MDKISTSGDYDTDAHEARRMVSATHTESVSVLRGLVAGIGGIVGGKSDTMNKKVDDVMEHLVKGLVKGLSANERVVGAQFQFTEFGRSERNIFLSGIATGTVIGPKSSHNGGGRSSNNKRRQTRRIKRST
jgi:uncharacterized protein YbjQ (UPF0145 family)